MHTKKYSISTVGRMSRFGAALISMFVSVLYISNFIVLLKEVSDAEHHFANDLPSIATNVQKRMKQSRSSHSSHETRLKRTEGHTLENEWNVEYDSKEYDQQRKYALRPFLNVTTVAYPHGPFGGFRNQYMTFTGMILMTAHANHSQIIVESVKWKDLFGTNQRLRHDLFFDVVHWNSMYPSLPRFVEYDRNLYGDVTFLGKTDTTPTIKWNVQDILSATNPYAIGSTGLQAQNQYKQYVKRVVDGLQDRHNMDLLMLKGAFRPHPALQRIMYDFWKQKGLSSGYMALHARVEPDMQKHNMCTDVKVTNITHIIEMLQDKFPDPPKPNILLIFNREILEAEVKDKTIDNVLAHYNLKVINDIVRTGLWNGRVNVHEAGVNLAKNSLHDVYSKYFSLSGSIMDFFLAVQADIFVGTEVSSFSVDVEVARFYRGKRENYHYVPDNLVITTPLEANHPPRFKC